MLASCGITLASGEELARLTRIVVTFCSRRIKLVGLGLLLHSFWNSLEYTRSIPCLSHLIFILILIIHLIKKINVIKNKYNMIYYTLINHIIFIFITLIFLIR
jgi:hypothetical protein